MSMLYSVYAALSVMLDSVYAALGVMLYSVLTHDHGMERLRGKNQLCSTMMEVWRMRKREMGDDENHVEVTIGYEQSGVRPAVLG